MLEQRPFPSDAAYATRLRRWHLANESLVNGVVPKRHAFDLEKRLIAGRTHVAGIFAEWTFRFQRIGGNFSFQNYFRGRGNLQWNGLAGNQIDGFPSQRAGHRELVQGIRHFRHRNISDGRIGSDHNGNGSWFIHFVVSSDVPSRVLPHADQEAGFVWTFDLHAVGTDVSVAGLRVFGDDIRRGKKRTWIFAYRPDWNRQLADIDLIAVQHVFFAGPGLNHAWRNRIAKGLIPFAVNAFH